MRTTLWLVALIALSVGATSLVSYASTDAIIVANGNDSGPGSFRWAVAEAESQTASSTITFSDSDLIVGLDGDEVSYSGERPLLIDGAGATVRAGGNSRILNLAEGTVATIEDLTLRGGQSESGGAIRHGGDGDLTLTRSTLIHNAAEQYGGAVWHRGGQGDLTLDESNLANNTAIQAGAVFVGYGSRGGALNVMETRFEDNRVSGGATSDGGAIGTGQEVEMSVRKSVFDGNTAATPDALGGAIFMTGSTSLEVEGSTFVGNSAQYGGAVSTGPGPPNRATFTNSTFTENVATEYGGAVSGSGTFRHVTFLSNGASEGAHLWWGWSDAELVGTVLADPQGSASCYFVFGESISSFSYETGNSCGLSAPSDIANGSDPELGALGDYGGATSTLLPAPGSPLAAAIPEGECHVGADQRGVSRPHGGGCDIGAVEQWVPGRVSDVTVDPGDGEAHVAWEAPADTGRGDLVDYRVSATESEGEEARVTEVVDATSRNETLGGLDNGADYAVTVVAVNEEGYSAPSAAVSVRPRTVPDAQVSRIAGANRFATAAQLSASRFDPGVDVYVATGTNFADALTGGVAAGLDDAPLLLVTSESVPDDTANELQRLDPRRIIVLGGPSAVGTSVASQLSAFTDGHVERISGPDRFATAAAVSQATFADAETVYVATGLGFPDGLAGAPAAVQADGPLLLATSDSLPRPTADELARLNPGRIVILGGTSVIGSSVESKLRDYGQVDRIAGQNRFDTAAQVVGELDDPRTVYVATGGAFADALTAGAVAGVENAPVLLVTHNTIPMETGQELERISPSSIVVMGGTAAVSDGAQSQLDDYLSN